MSVKRDQFTQYNWVVNDPDRRENGVRDSAPAPAVMQTGTFENNKSWGWAWLTERHTFFWADLLSMQRYGSLYLDLTKDERLRIISTFNGITSGSKFLTNDRGSTTRHNYLNGENADKEDIQVAPLICCDDWVRVLGVETNSHGVEMALLDGFLQGDPLPKVTRELLQDPRILWATVINKKGEISNFPQLDTFPVPYPRLTSKPYWYPYRDLEKV